VEIPEPGNLTRLMGPFADILTRPAKDLSHGRTGTDIIHMIAVTAVQAGQCRQDFPACRAHEGAVST
jgi:hypothetical protein